MSSYHCTVNPPGVPVREIAAFAASDEVLASADAERLRALHRAA